MMLDIKVHLHYRLAQPTDLLLQVEAADGGGQQLVRANINLSETEHFSRIAAEEGLGERIWLRANGDFLCDYSARIAIRRPVEEVGSLAAVAPHLLPADTVRYLMPSRYCPCDELQAFVSAEFGQLSGGARIAAMLDWIGDKFQYVVGSSTGQTTALDTFVQRQGICRDFAHVMICLARASAIPARFASVYAPDVTPPDFHAMAEVFLNDAWHLVDATGMAQPDATAIIGVGLDAAEVAFLSSYGPMQLISQSVDISTAQN
ncbi:transglutaminase domain-containing protein [Anderseniella sp. Alg231-50]|uniref:transglutaminase domain-containing protein n=1 Tax=Anderseniella sp. Alg231-50 TaxID=1922226 RepID=UPI000D556970